MFSQHYKYQQKYQQKSKYITVLSYFKLRLLLTLSMRDEKFLACSSDPGGISLERFHDLQNLSFVFMDWPSLLAHRSLPSTNNNRWTDADLRFTTTRISLVVAATVSRESRGILRNNAWFVSHVGFRVSDLHRDLLLFYFYSFKHDHYFISKIPVNLRYFQANSICAGKCWSHLNSQYCFDDNPLLVNYRNYDVYSGQRSMEYSRW